MSRLIKKGVTSLNRKEWEVKIRLAMFEEGLTVTELAKELGYSRQHVGDTITGRRGSYNAAVQISDHLGVVVYDR